jgi:hypothetical protein
MPNKRVLTLLALLIFCVAATQASAQTKNLLQNPKADLETQHWRASGQATIEDVNGNHCFVVRNGGYFIQDVILPEDAAGKFALLIAHGASDRINSDGAITGLPYLYGYMMVRGGPDDGRILSYIQNASLRCSANLAGEWVTMRGIVQVPEGTGTIRFFLKQALQQGVPHNGSAARFDDLGLFLFPTEAEAKAFAAGYN